MRVVVAVRVIMPLARVSWTFQGPSGSRLPSGIETGRCLLVGPGPLAGVVHLCQHFGPAVGGAGRGQFHDIVGGGSPLGPTFR